MPSIITSLLYCWWSHLSVGWLYWHSVVQRRYGFVGWRDMQALSYAYINADVTPLLLHDSSLKYYDFSVSDCDAPFCNIFRLSAASIAPESRWPSVHISALCQNSRQTSPGKEHACYLPGSNKPTPLCSSGGRGHIGSRKGIVDHFVAVNHTIVIS